MNIEDNINKYIPSFPADKNITLRNLLTHTSLPDQGKVVLTRFTFKISNMDWFAALQFPAGTGWKYTDYNYMVLAYIVEKFRTNRSLNMKENIFTPVEMHESGMGATLLKIFFSERLYKKMVS